MTLRRTTALPLVALLALAPLSACGSDEKGSDAASPREVTTVSVDSASPEAGSSESPSDEVSVASTPESAVTAESSGPASATATAGAPVEASAAASLPAGTKKYATAKLPATVGKYTGSNGMYTAGSEDAMVMMTLSPALKFNTVTAKLTGKSTEGMSTCGKAEGVTSCFAPLDGGVLWVQGTDLSKPAELAQLTNDVYKTFA